MKLEPGASGPPNAFNTLRDVSRNLVYRPSTCPLGIMASNHWTFREGLPFDGDSARCLCEDAK